MNAQVERVLLVLALAALAAVSMLAWSYDKRLDACRCECVCSNPPPVYTWDVSTEHVTILAPQCDPETCARQGVTP